MKAIILGLLTIVGVALAEQADMKYFLYVDNNGTVRVEDLTLEPDLSMSASDLTYYFYSRSNPTTAVVVQTTNASELTNSAFTASKDTTFIIHGWRSQAESEINYLITANSLIADDVNVFVVDWSPIAKKIYTSAQGSVRKIGEYVAQFIQQLQSIGLQLSKTQLVGHSLGAHIAGNAGAALKGQVGAIVGLDSAGPLFFSAITSNRLDPTDGKYVHVIHCNGGLLGFLYSHGHSDYYPNGGSSQPGCGADIAGTCSHSRCPIYYAESLISSKFVAKQCSSYFAYTSGNCDNADSSLMGRFDVDQSAQGNYYLTTNEQSPFARG